MSGGRLAVLGAGGIPRLHPVRDSWACGRACLAWRSGPEITWWIRRYGRDPRLLCKMGQSHADGTETGRWLSGPARPAAAAIRQQSGDVQTCDRIAGAAAAKPSGWRRVGSRECSPRGTFLPDQYIVDCTGSRDWRKRATGCLLCSNLTVPPPTSLRCRESSRVGNFSQIREAKHQEELKDRILRRQRPAGRVSANAPLPLPPSLPWSRRVFLEFVALAMT